MPNDVFTEPTVINTNPDNQTEIASQLVGEDKKFKTVNDLAKGKLEADVYIEQMKVQLKAANDELAKVKNADDKFSKILEQIGQRNNESTPQVNTTPAMVNDDITALVRNQITAIEKERSAQQNIDTTNSKLKELFGDRAKEIVESKAKELGVGMEELKILSSKSPSALLTLVGAGNQTTQATNAPQGSINTQADLGIGVKAGSKEYYNELRRKNPTEYYKKTIHEVMDKVSKGELVL